MRVVDLIRFGMNQLEVAGVEQAALEVELLLGFCLEKSRSGLFLAAGVEVDERQEQKFLSLLARRVSHEPTAYILGGKKF